MFNSSSKKLKIGIAAKPSEDAAKKAASLLADFLQEEEFEYFVDKTLKKFLDGFDSKYEQANCISRKDFTNTCDIIVVFGGDGTFISVARHPSPQTKTIIGVNMGSLGFLTEISEKEVISILKSALTSSAKVEERFLLKAAVIREGSLAKEFYAMNDVVISKDTLARIFSVSVEIDSNSAVKVRGDGVIVATPSGSTAYSLAAGGSIVHPSVSALLLTPICPHSLTSRPVVLPGTSKLSLALDNDNELEESIYFTVDGQEGMALTAGDKIEVTTSEFAYNVAKSPSHSYYDVLTKKLVWGAKGRA